MTVSAIRAPFRIRAAAVAQRRLRALEREVLELRTLPLRQAEEDDMLAAEARLGGSPQRVMAIRPEPVRLSTGIGEQVDSPREAP
jgi:hypothetical protein